MSSAMKFSQAVKVLSKLGPEHAVLIRGDHGIGKSSLAKAVAEEVSKRKGIEYNYIDKRLAQMTEGDMMGLMKFDDVEGNDSISITDWCPPRFMYEAQKLPSFLMLDELNRASREVSNIGLQLSLDRETSNGIKLHPDTYVYAAINVGGSYQVNRLDPALLARFYIVDLVFDAEEWFAWAKKQTDIAPTWLDFLRGNPAFLETVAKNPNEKGTDARSAHKCGQALFEVLAEGDERRDRADELKAQGVTGKDAYYDRDTVKRIVNGFMGKECGIAFDEHLVGLSEKVNVFTGKDIFEDYVDIRNNIDRNRPDVMVAVVDRFLAHCETIPSVKDMTVTERQGNNFTLLLGDLPPDYRVPLYPRFLKPGMARVDFLKAIHPYGVRLLLEAFGTKPGEEGVGMLPTNPGAVIRDDAQAAE